MATWKDVYDETSESFLNSYDGYYETNVNGKVYAALQYDADTITTTSVTLRFKLGCTPLSNYYDEYHVLLDPTDADNRSLHLLKNVYTQNLSKDAAKKKWPYYASTTFTSTKAAKDAAFPIPAFWLMNDGWNNTPTETAKAFYNNYKSGGSRGSALRSTIKATTVEIAADKSVATDGSRPTVVVVDKGNNTCMISGVLGKNGANNAIRSATLYYTLDGSDPSSSSTRTTISLTATSGAAYSKSILITKTCKVRAYVECVFTYNITYAATSDSVVITFYPTPAKPSSVKLEDSSYKNGRLTIKNPWTFTWSKCANAKGYFIMLMKLPEGSSTWEYVRGKYISSTSDNYINIALGANIDDNINYFAKRQSTSCTAIFKDPSTLGISPGDKIRLRIKSFNINGIGQTLQLSGADGTTDSPAYLVQNAGIVHVKVAGSWVEGQVYVKANNEWHEAETVNAKVNGTWEESQ